MQKIYTASLPHCLERQTFYLCVNKYALAPLSDSGYHLDKLFDILESFPQTNASSSPSNIHSLHYSVGIRGLFNGQRFKLLFVKHKSCVLLIILCINCGSALSLKWDILALFVGS